MFLYMFFMSDLYLYVFMHVKSNSKRAKCAWGRTGRAERKRRKKLEKRNGQKQPSCFYVSMHVFIILFYISMCYEMNGREKTERTETTNLNYTGI